MKRIGDLYDRIISLENLRMADQSAMKGKRRSYGVIRHLANQEENLLKLHESLKNQQFKTSTYDVFDIVADAGKVRTIYRLPYYPDRIVHHAVLNVLEPIWVSVFINNTYSCIKGRGVHLAHKHILSALKDECNTAYCLKIDIKKYYPSIDHDTLKSIVAKKIKDKKVLNLLYEVIDSAPGIPIGNYLSQYFANLYLSYFDHWVKEVLKVKYYYRYADDIVIFHADKGQLHTWLGDIRAYLESELKLTLNNKYQVFPVDKRGVDFLGYVYTHRGSRLRKRIKQSMFRKLSRVIKDGSNDASIMKLFASYNGWMKHCDTRNLVNVINTKYLNEKVF